MLEGYGVIIGEFVSSGREQGKWLHAILNLKANGQSYQAAVDVNEPNGGFQYRIIANMDAELFTNIAALADGLHELASNGTSGAMDYVRSPILQEKLGSGQWLNVTGDEAGNALVAMVTGSQKVYVFGATYQPTVQDPQKGAHDVHYNQGDPVGQHFSQNGIWQDGCVFAKLKDGSFSAYLGKFDNQSMSTDDNGNPIGSPNPAISPKTPA